MNFDLSLHRQITDILLTGGIENAAQEARWILEDYPDAETARSIAQRRANHEPLQYLLKRWEFYGLPIKVGEGVLAPRQDTEILVEKVLERIGEIPGMTVLDLCTGSGCIALALKRHNPELHVIGVDISETALGYAKQNAELLSLPVLFMQGDVLSKDTAARFGGMDVIVCNPPYLTAEDMANLQPEVSHEPALALDGGTDGLDFYRGITKLWCGSPMKRGGMLAYEVGKGQAEQVAEIMYRNALEDITICDDLSGIERVVIGYKSEE